MPAPDPESPGKPDRASARAVVIATAGIVGIMGLAVFYVAVVAPLREVHKVVRDFSPTGSRVIAGFGFAGLDERDKIAINRLGGPEHATCQLVRYFRLPRWTGAHRWRAVLLLAGCGSQAVPALVKILGHEDVNMRSTAAWALGEIGPEAKDAVPALIKTLGDTNAAVRKNAVLALGKIRSDTKETVSALVEMLDDPDGYARSLAALALGLIGPSAKDAIPALTKALEGGDAGMCHKAAFALGRIGPEAKAAVPALEKLLRNPDEIEAVRREAAEALRRIRGEALPEDTPDAAKPGGE